LSRGILNEVYFPTVDSPQVRDLGYLVTESCSGPPATALGIHFADVAVPSAQRSAVRFTFFWPEGGRWEGRDFGIEVVRGEGQAGT